MSGALTCPEESDPCEASSSDVASRRGRQAGRRGSHKAPGPESTAPPSSSDDEDGKGEQSPGGAGSARKRKAISIEDLVHRKNVEVANSGSRERSSDRTRGASHNIIQATNMPSSMMETNERGGVAETRACSHCGTTSTPSWRRNNFGALLCNACGLYERIHRTPRTLVVQEGLIRVRRRSAAELGARKCANCQTSRTPMWRRIEGVYYCNACAIFYRTNGTHRPHPNTGPYPPPPPPDTTL